MTAFVMNLSSVEEAVTSTRRLALLRIRLLHDDGVGFAACFAPLLKKALDSWFCAVQDETRFAQPPHCSSSCEEKKQEQVQQREPLLSTLLETSVLSRTLRVHAAVSRLDPTLAEELGRQGSHAALSRLVQYDACKWQEEEDQDVIMELQDYCCTVAALAGGAFPLKVAPFTIHELRCRLPLSFQIASVSNDKTADASNKEASDNLVLIHQVTERQSAQEDVGFVMWPSAVVLSRWLVYNSHRIKGRSVLELGAGCGLTGLVAATLEPSSVVLTDYNPKVLQNLERNIALNNVANSTCAVGLDFYQQRGDANSWADVDGSLHERVDVIVAADVICQPEDAVAVAKTIHDALLPKGVATVICANAKHRFGVDSFEVQCRAMGLRVSTTSNVLADLDQHNGELVSQELELTTGYVEGMVLTKFEIDHDSAPR